MIKLIVFLLNVLKILLVVPFGILALTLDKLKMKSNGLSWTIIIILYPVLLVLELILVKYLLIFSLIGIVWVFHTFAEYVLAPIAVVLMIPVIIIFGFVFVILLLLLGEFAK
ncbi:hypothetical protein [Nosocomiicoccus sp. HMSC09A07]|uniref:hypothetical protein n=1 Tax=Nosocomiicoccus sp. HMSC09A07 TaxID=1581145 RepID=UPI0008A30103|nr:hypothetical protein [Nosocomiicoccus sp. HMSC09A07]OFS63400.1 hypothetical protein HMPREF3177_03120 [Nosocomiicoccus sp. HMSC09A07]